MQHKLLFDEVIKYFKNVMPVAETELHFSNAYQLIVAVILSAQCTDKRVNTITPAFFEKFPEPEVLMNASQEEVFEVIKSISYPNNKSKNLIGMAKTLMNEFGGVVPEEVDDLLKLPGVGRKTANVIASVVYNKPALAVDTHVFRVAARIGLTKNAKNPLETERQLLKYVPEDVIPIFHHWLILHGRYICVARNPRCNQCGLVDVCKFYLTNVALTIESKHKTRKIKKTLNKSGSE